MTGNHQYTVVQEQIADRVREAQLWRLASGERGQTTRTRRPARLLHVWQRLARPSTT